MDWHVFERSGDSGVAVSLSASAAIVGTPDGTAWGRATAFRAADVGAASAPHAAAGELTARMPPLGMLRTSHRADTSW